MKIAAFIGILLLATLQGPVEAPGTVTGIVTESATGAPLPSVQIRLTRTPQLTPRPETITGYTGADGRFLLSAPPGSYTLLVQRPGYFGPPVNGVPRTDLSREIVLPAGGTLDMRFALTSGGIIAGQVLDHNGTPSPETSVIAMQFRYRDGLPQLASVRSVQTDERGEYRIYWLPPGEYFVAFDPGFIFTSNTVILSDSGLPRVQTRTFHPGTTDPSRARMISVAAGSEVRGVNFAIQTTEVLNISGRVINPLSSSGVNPDAEQVSDLPSFRLISRDSIAVGDLRVSAYGNALPLADMQQGLFELRTIPPGRYDLYAEIDPLDTALAFWGRVTIDLGLSDLKDVNIVVRPPVELHGRIVSAGGALTERTPVQLRSAYRSPFIPADTNAAADGAFIFRSVPEGEYRIAVELPEGWSIADVRQGERSVMNDGVIRVDANGSEHVQVLVAPGGGTIAGVAAVAGGSAGFDTTVVAIPAAPSRQNHMLFRTARADESGRFRITGITPGAYRLFAWEGAPETAWLNADFLARYEDRGVSVAAPGGAIEDVQLQTISPGQ